jgi:gluconolactonase
MKRPPFCSLAALFVAALTVIPAVDSHADDAPRAVLPDAVVDLRSVEGTARVKAQWRYSDTVIQQIDHRSVGPDLKASGPKNRTFDFTPDARAADFDDSTWEIIPADSLEKRRGNGRLSFNWYRITVTIPEKVGGFATKGGTAVFEIVVDDYAEVWVNGKAPFVLGQNGGSIAAGWNAPNRVVLTRDAKPGEKFQIAVLGINGPHSTHPDTYIWVRSATLDFYAPGKLSKAREVKLEVDRKVSALDAILPARPKLEKLADGFAFTEGPVWVPDGEGYLLFSDPNNNVIYRMTPDGDVSVYLTPGIGVGRTTSKAEIRSVATMSRKSPRSKTSRTFPLANAARPGISIVVMVLDARAPLLMLSSLLLSLS